MRFYLVFLDLIKRQGEAALNSGSGKDARVTMDVDPLPKAAAYERYVTILTNSLCLYFDDRLHADVSIAPIFFTASASKTIQHATAHINHQQA